MPYYENKPQLVYFNMFKQNMVYKKKGMQWVVFTQRGWFSYDMGDFHASSPAVLYLDQNMASPYILLSYQEWSDRFKPGKLSVIPTQAGEAMFFVVY